MRVVILILINSSLDRHRPLHLLTELGFLLGFGREQGPVEEGYKPSISMLCKSSPNGPMYSARHAYNSLRCSK